LYVLGNSVKVPGFWTYSGIVLLHD
jgi:hypothetical protein